MTSQAGQGHEVATSTETAPRRALLDTTVQLDRRKTDARKLKIEALLDGFDWTFSTGLSLVEFKATVIQQCITIHNQLRRTGARFTRVRDALLEKQGQQVGLRAHIFNNIIQVFASSFEVTEESDRLLAEKARLLLENIIPQLYDWFAKESVDSVLNDVLGCDRAKEPPRKKRAAFEVNLPRCERGKNKHCRVEEVIRNDGPSLAKSLQPYLEQSEQFQGTIGVFHKVFNNPKADLSHGDCRNAGDCLIALEARGKVTHAVSTNAREWGPLSAALGFEFVRITYPEEKTV